MPSKNSTKNKSHDVLEIKILVQNNVKNTVKPFKLTTFIR